MCNSKDLKFPNDFPKMNINIGAIALINIMYDQGKINHKTYQNAINNINHKNSNYK